MSSNLVFKENTFSVLLVVFPARIPGDPLNRISSVETCAFSRRKFIPTPLSIQFEFGCQARGVMSDKSKAMCILIERFCDHTKH